MDGLPQFLANSIDSAMDELCEELLKIKRSYFSPRGKPSWKPLKQATLKKKDKLYPSNSNNFNTATGKLRDSLDVTWQWIDSTTIRLTIEVHEDEFVEYLTKTLGRDFLTIDNVEKIKLPPVTNRYLLYFQLFDTRACSHFL